MSVLAKCFVRRDVKRIQSIRSTYPPLPTQQPDLGDIEVANPTLGVTFFANRGTHCLAPYTLYTI
jgi:hypothetical protein